MAKKAKAISYQAASAKAIEAAAAAMAASHQRGGGSLRKWRRKLGSGVASAMPASMAIMVAAIGEENKVIEAVSNGVKMSAKQQWLASWRQGIESVMAACRRR
jgi:uncharacterized membrane protein